MLERICPACDQGNALDQLTCTACGASLDQRSEQPLARRENHSLAQRLPQIPQRWQPAAKALALGATALAIEVGTALFRQANERPATSTALAKRDEPALKPRVVRRRVWRTYRNGNLEYETHEETQWFGD